MVLPNIELDVLALNLAIIWVSYLVPITFGVALGMLIHDWSVLKAMNRSDTTVTWLKEKKTHVRNRTQ